MGRRKKGVEVDTSGRTEKGKFASGNKRAKGNPFDRRMKAYRVALAKALTPEMIAGVIRAMTREALKGDVAAGKLVLSYAVGLPKITVDSNQPISINVNTAIEQARLELQAAVCPAHMDEDDKQLLEEHRAREGVIDVAPVPDKEDGD